MKNVALFAVGVLLGTGSGLCAIAGEQAAIAPEIYTDTLAPQVSTSTTETLLPSSTTATTDVFISTIPFRIAHPYEGQHLPLLRSSFVFGTADPRGQLTVNGKPVPIHQGGGWLAMVDYSTGPFTLKAELAFPSTSFTLVRNVVLPIPQTGTPSTRAYIDRAGPDSAVKLQPGGVLYVDCSGSTCGKAVFSINGKGKYPMVETAENSGYYRGSYIIKQRDEFDNARIKVTLTDPRKNTAIAVAKGRVTVLDESIPWMVEVSTDIGVIRAGSAVGPEDKGGYMLFPPKGTRLRVTGQKGGEYKVRLNRTREGWIGEDEVAALPSCTPVPFLVVGNVIVGYRDSSTVVRVPLRNRIPFEVSSSDDRRSIDITFFGAMSNTDWVIYDSSRAIVSGVKWFQDDPETYRLHLNVPPNWLGYDARYENNAFIFEVRTLKPFVGNIAHLPLEGCTVAVDAGHSPDTGAIGITGLLERDANRDIVAAVSNKLTALGATVYLLRPGDDAVPLYDRPRRARLAKADILVSIHNNALGEGGNPLEKHGYGVYYFYPHSESLARSIYEAFSTFVGIPFSERDDGFYHANFALTRVSQMPSVLVECAYMIHPEEEWLLHTDAYRNACADAVAEGIKRFVTSLRPVPPPPAPEPAPQVTKKRRK
jgi:N-acetylmuramoyl-L-alanine amidase